MRLPGRKLAVRSYRWARSRVTGGAVVLGYHRIATPGRDPFDLAIEPESFHAQIRFLAQHSTPMRLRDAATAVRERRAPSRAVVVTFDDGYADTVMEALPTLEQHGVPATVFVTTGEPGREYWWDELTRTLLEPTRLPGTLRLRVAGTQREWPVSAAADAAARRALLFDVAGALRRLPQGERVTAMQDIRRWAGQTNGQACHRALTTDEVRELAASPWIEIGAHTVSHPELAALPVSEQLLEAQVSRIQLEEIIGGPVKSFSYPHGSCSPATRAAVLEAGFDLACSSVPDVLTRSTDPLAVPRLWVNRQSEAAFIRWMNRWLPN